MADGEHKDFGRNALPLLNPDLDAPISSQKLLVVVTLAAIVIAGSTLAYRTRSYPFSSFVPVAAKQENGYPSGTGKDQVQGKQLSNGYVDAPGEGSLNGEEGDDSHSQAEGNGGGKDKEGKSSRKKDRRKRGKDPLKEILKGKSKGKTLEQLLESSAQTPSTPTDSLLGGNNKFTNDSSTNPTQKLSNGSTSGPDTDPEKVSTQLADVSQKPHRTTAAFSPSTQSSTPLLSSTANRNPSRRRARSPETLQSGAQTNGDLSLPPAPSDTTSSIPASFVHSVALTTGYGADADADRNSTRSAPKHDQALGAAANGLAVNVVGLASSTSTGLLLETEGESAGETEISAGMSMSSSIVFSESGVDHARSAEEAEITPVTSPASSEKSGRTPKLNRDAAKVAPTISEGNAHQPSTELVDPWDWDGVSTNVTSSIASTSSSKSDRTMNSTSSHVPLPDSSITPVYTSFSSAVLSNKGKALAPSSSLNSLSDSNEQRFKMSASTSAPGVASTKNNPPSPPSAIPAESNRQGSSKDKEEDETAITFPTLNPPSSTASAGAGPSRIRLPLGDIHPSASTGRASPSIGAKRRPPTPSRNNSHSHSHNANSGGTPPPQRPITPSSASAAGSESPTPSQAKPALSIQTQLASMRGALEASRLREEKNKVEMEKYVKEIETMKWENANWRRAEIELQAQIRNLMHQLQIYTSVFAASAHLQQQYAANITGTGPTGLNNSSSPSPLYSANSAATASSTTATLQQPSTTTDQTADNLSPATPQISQQAGPPPSQVTNPISVPHHPVPQPLSLHMLHMNGMASPSAILSPSGPMSPGFPIASYPGAPPPFFPYAIPPHLQPTSTQFAMAHAQHMHMQQFQQHQATIAQAQAQAQALPSPHQASLFSAIFPPPQHGAASHFGSTPSSAAGTSSVGSQSPDRSGSPVSGPSFSRRKSRARTQTANSRMGGRSTWEEVGDGWVGASSSQDVGNDGEARTSAPELSDDDASEGGFNEVLADAIFKRPASIRVRSSSRSLRSAFEADKSSKGDSVGTSPGAPASEVAEQFTEFAFPSLTDMGNIIYQSSVKSTNGAHSSGTSTSTSSSLSLSPVVDTSVAPELPEETSASNDAEEERPHSLPPVMEQPEEGDGLPEANLIKQVLLQNDDVTPTQDADPIITPRGAHPLRSQSSTSDVQAETSVAGGKVESEDVTTPGQ